MQRAGRTGRRGGWGDGAGREQRRGREVVDKSVTRGRVVRVGGRRECAVFEELRQF